MSEFVNGRASTDGAKQHIIERLYALWRQWPHLRLGQLILAIEPYPYYREDEPLMDMLEQGYATIASGEPRQERLLRRMAQEARRQTACGETEDGGFAVEDAPYSEHYKGHPFEPVDIAEAYSLDFNEGNVVKYLLRWRKKDGIKDLEKARYYIERLISLEEKRLQKENG